MGAHLHKEAVKPKQRPKLCCISLGVDVNFFWSGLLMIPQLFEPPSYKYSFIYSEWKGQQKSEDGCRGVIGSHKKWNFLETVKLTLSSHSNCLHCKKKSCQNYGEKLAAVVAIFSPYKTQRSCIWIYGKVN